MARDMAIATGIYTKTNKWIKINNKCTIIIKYKEYENSMILYFFLLTRDISLYCLTIKNNIRWKTLFCWQVRRERDSNPRYPYEYNTLAGCRFQPLSHLSKKERGRKFIRFTLFHKVFSFFIFKAINSVTA